MTRRKVMAVSVVLMGQMCRSWIAAAPGRSARKDRTAPSSTPSGTALKDMPTEFRNRPHVLHRMTAQMIKLMAGSSHSLAVQRISAADTTTPHRHSEDVAQIVPGVGHQRG